MVSSTNTDNTLNAEVTHNWMAIQYLFYTYPSGSPTLAIKACPQNCLKFTSKLSLDIWMLGEW